MMHCREILFTAIAIALCTVLAGCLAPELTVHSNPASSDSAPQARVVFLAGPDSHRPGEHEHRAGSELLARALRERQPGADAIVLYCDGGRKHLINQHLETFNRLLDLGVGIVALHYCVEVPKESPSADSMLAATGGYFETWWSVNPFWDADYRQLPEHPITRDISPFELRDEWYFNMRFNERGVTPILSAVPPPETMARRNGPHSGNDAVRKMVADRQPQVTAWAFEREDGGRGFGYTGGHFHANWQDDSARKLVLNAIEWVAAPGTVKPAGE
jgi:hypothetical protein